MISERLTYGRRVPFQASRRERKRGRDLTWTLRGMPAPPWVVVERADGLWQVTVRGPVPVEGVDHQFLRVQILRP